MSPPSDSDEFGALTEIVSRFVGALIAYLVIAGLVLSTSLKLGIVVLVTAPLIVLFAMPLLRPLQRREEIERSRTSDLTSMATDIVAGLRILRGIGGEQTFARNYAEQSQYTRQAAVSAGVWQAAVEAHRRAVLRPVPGRPDLARGRARSSAGDLSVGQLISFFGYAIFMVWPIQTFFELAQKWVRSVVSARKTIAVLDQQPPWQAPRAAVDAARPRRLHDQESGFIAAAGRVHDHRVGSARTTRPRWPTGSAAICPADHEPVSLDVDDGLKGRAARRARKQQRAERDPAGRARPAARRAEVGREPRHGGPRRRTIDQVRERIVVSDTGSQVFAGTLQSAIDPHGRLSLDRGRDGAACRRGRGRLRRLARTVGRAGSTNEAAACPAASGSGWCWRECWGSTRRS